MEKELSSLSKVKENYRTFKISASLTLTLITFDHRKTNSTELSAHLIPKSHLFMKINTTAVYHVTVMFLICTESRKKREKEEKM